MVVKHGQYICNQHKYKIQATQTNVLKRTEGVGWKDRITNYEILLQLGQVAVQELVKKRQEEWNGH